MESKVAKEVASERSTRVLLVCCLAFSLLLLVTLRLFLDDPHHRIAGVAWTGLIQLLSPLSLILSMLILSGLIVSGLKRLFGLNSSTKAGTAIKVGLAGLILGSSSILCLNYSMPILLSI